MCLGNTRSQIPGRSATPASCGRPRLKLEVEALTGWNNFGVKKAALYGAVSGVKHIQDGAETYLEHNVYDSLIRSIRLTGRQRLLSRGLLCRREVAHYKT